MSCLELCAGAGGMALGLQRAGFDHVLLVERDPACVSTLAANGFPGTAAACVGETDYRPYAGRVDLVAGGVPCQAFSRAGKHRGAADSRNLWPEAVRCVREVRPKAFLFENAATMASHLHAAYLRQLVAQLGELGYAVTQHLVDAADFGVPQRRRRLLLVGTRHDVAAFEAPAPVPRSTVRQALRTLGPPGSDPHHVAAGHTARPGAREYKGHTPSALDKPSKAVVAGVHGCPGGANTVRLDDGSMRYYTPRELARVQSFPDSYRLPPGWSACVRQLGNAAPPALIHAFAAPLRRVVAG